MTSKRYAKEIREEVLQKIRQGEKVSELAEKYGMSKTTIRDWLKGDSCQSSEILELGKLRKENRDLYELIGKYAFGEFKEKKKT